MNVNPTASAARLPESLILGSLIGELLETAIAKYPQLVKNDFSSSHLFGLSSIGNHRAETLALGLSDEAMKVVLLFHC